MLATPAFEASAAAVACALGCLLVLLAVWRRRSRVDTTASVTIVGGSFAGVGIARHLGTGATVIERQRSIEYTPGILRSYVDPDSYLHLCADVTESLPQCKVVQGSVSAIDITEGDILVKMSKGMHVGAKAVVIATGSSYPIAKPDGESAVGKGLPRRNQLEHVADSIRRAASVLLVGGGPVGIELAGELVHTYGVSKRITVITSAPTLLHGMHPALGKAALDWLQARGVRVILQDGVDVPQGAGPHSLPHVVPGRSLLTQHGLPVQADLVMPCMGARPGTDWVGATSQPLAGSLDERGRIRVNASFEVLGLEGKGVFACGDCAAHPAAEPALAHSAEKQATVVADNVRRHLQNVQAKQRGEPLLPLLSYPDAISGPNPLANPVIVCISLGPWHALLDFNGRIVLSDPWVGQRVAGLAKRLIEATKVDEMRGGVVGCTFWALADPIATAMSRYCLPRVGQGVGKDASGRKQE